MVNEAFPPFVREYFFNPEKMCGSLTYNGLFRLMNGELGIHVGYGIYWMRIPGWLGESNRYRNYEQGCSGIVSSLSWTFSTNKDKSSITFTPVGSNAVLFPHFGVVLRENDAPVLLIQDCGVSQSQQFNYHPRGLVEDAMRNVSMSMSEALLWEVFMGVSVDENVEAPLLAADDARFIQLFSEGLPFSLLLEGLIGLVGKKNICGMGVGRKNLLKLSQKIEESGINE